MPLGRLSRWLLYLSDPQCPQRPPCAKAPNFEEFSYLLDLAAEHGTVAAFAENMDQDYCRNRLDQLQFDQLKSRADEILLPNCARSMILRKHLELFIEAGKKQGLRAVEIKGADFADNIYPDQSKRPFTDLDILARREDMPALGEVALSLGFETMETLDLKHDDPYGECGFITRSHGVDILLELHWNLVNSPALQKSVSVLYDDVTLDGHVTPEGRLIIAAVHAATSHQYDKLKFFFDAVQAIRAGEQKFDLQRLKQLISKTGCGKIISMACHLSKNLTGDNRTAELAKKLQLPAPPIIDRLLMNSRIVSPASRVLLRKARMCGYRHRLKRRQRLSQITG